MVIESHLHRERHHQQQQHHHQQQLRRLHSHQHVDGDSQPPISKVQSDTLSTAGYAGMRPVSSDALISTTSEADVSFNEVYLSADTYGAAIYAFIYDARELLSGDDHDAKPYWLNAYRLTYVMAVLFVNYTFQSLMLYWIGDFVVKPAVHSVQYQYRIFHTEFFTDEGSFMLDEWDSRQTKHDWLYKHRLCHMVFSSTIFLAFILMMWLMTMVIEMRKNFTLLHDICSVPHCPSRNPSLMVRGTGGGFEETEADDDKILIQGLTPCVRLLTIVLILLPKFTIAFLLTVLGVVWLSATQSFSELILNALALQFVVSIGDYLFDALLPEGYRGEMDKVALQIPRKVLSDEEKVAEDWQYWKNGTLICLFIPIIVFGYLKCLQSMPWLGILPHFKDDISQACDPFLYAHKLRLCYDGFTEGCFSYGGWNPHHPEL